MERTDDLALCLEAIEVPGPLLGLIEENLSEAGRLHIYIS